MDGLLMENPTKMDDLGVPLFSETSIYRQMLQMPGKLGHWLLVNQPIQVFPWRSWKRCPTEDSTKPWSPGTNWRFPKMAGVPSPQIIPFL